MMNKKRKSVFYLLIGLIMIAVTVSLAKSDLNDDVQNNIDESFDDCITVHYIDVGQGDSEFIELPDGECMLIDAGTNESAPVIIDKIEGYGYSTIDYVVATHPHADHIGAMDEVIDHFSIGKIYMPKASTTTKTFENMLNAISDKGLKINTAKAGVTVLDKDGLKIELLAPVSTSYSELNNYSAVVKLTYGESTFLFMGDAEALAENELTYAELDADVLKVGHHGSRYSSSDGFINRVSPMYAVISCGVDNKYNHPHSETLSRLEKHQVAVYRTDTDGTIGIGCDGKGNFDIKYEDK